MEVRPGTWPVPPIVAHIADLGGLGGEEARATFNGGIGMALVVDPEAAPLASAEAERLGLGGWPIGRVVLAAEAGPSRYEDP